MTANSGKIANDPAGEPLDPRLADAEWQEDEDISLFALGTTLLRHRWRIAALMVIGLVLAVLPVIRLPLTYKATASFVPQEAQAGRSGLASLAGELGVAVSSGNPSQSSEFYVTLLKSREILGPISRQVFVVPEMGGKRVSFDQLFGISGDSASREEQGTELLVPMITTAVTKTTGIVDLAVATRWPSVSLAITKALVDGVIGFNQRTRAGQAAAERKFVETRLEIARSDLRAAEDRMEFFLTANKQLGSPSLASQHDRLSRDLSLKQQVFTTLTQAYEDARIREVHDIPVITVVEQPAVRLRPLPRGRTKRAVLGLLLGLVIGVVWAVISDLTAHRRRVGDPNAVEFFATLGDLNDNIRRKFRAMAVRSRRPAG